MIRFIFIWSVVLWFPLWSLAQEEGRPDTIIVDDVIILPSAEIDGDTMPQMFIKEVEILAPPDFNNRREYRRYSRLERNIKKVYPYAKFIRVKLEEVNTNLVDMTDDRERRKYIREVQRELIDHFEDDVRNMTFTQGKILIKLIDRETGESSYYWLQDLKGDLFAGFWQAIARIFGSNLKSEYDPYGEDAMIEYIVRMIDAGVL
jgi:hypothetical protein